MALYSEFNYITDSRNNLTYTVDMLRLKCSISFEKFSYLEFILKTCYNSFIDKDYVSTAFSDFRYNYTIKINDNSSFWFGYFPNSEKINKGGVSNPNTSHNFTIEFNPNKVKIEGFLKFVIDYIPFRSWEIKSCDIAIDIPTNILNICGFDKKRYKDIRVFTCGGDNKTIYIGRTQNRIKIYNKKIESGLDYDLTRLEVSTKLDLKLSTYLYYFNLVVPLPDLFLNDYLVDIFNLSDKTLVALVFAVNNGYNINDLPRVQKEKVKNLFHSSDERIPFDNGFVNSVFHKCIDYIFHLKD